VFEVTHTGGVTIHIAGAMLVRGGRVLLVHRHPKREAYPDCWDLAGGHIEPGETAEDALRRECREELGVEIETFVRFDMAVSNPNLALSSFLVTGWRGEPANAEPDEHDDLAWFSADEIDDLDLAHPEGRADLQSAARWQPS
jgi:8-oxo-dGTP diphosphatase